MSSAFDSEVYAERQRLPGVTINLNKLMQELMWSLENDKSVSLTLSYRPDVDTSMWWELRWGQNFAAAKSAELCLFRAAVMRRRDDERAKRYAGIEGADAQPADQQEPVE